MKTPSNTAKQQQTEDPKWLEVVRECVEEVRFGTVQIVIHEGRVTQVDATRRTRLAANSAGPH